MDERREMSEELQEITLAYVEGRRRGNGRNLEDLVKAYPQYARELVDFALHYHVSEEVDLDEATLSRVEQDDLRIEHQLLQEAFAQLRYPPELTSLVARAQQCGYGTIDKLADELDLTTDVVLLLEQRAVQPADLPAQLLERLGRVLTVAIQQLDAFFAQPRSTGYAFYSSEAAPETGRRITFVEAIRESQMMTREQKRRWLSMLGEQLDEPPAKPVRRRPTRRPRG